MSVCPKEKQRLVSCTKCHPGATNASVAGLTKTPYFPEIATCCRDRMLWTLSIVRNHPGYHQLTRRNCALECNCMQYILTFTLSRNFPIKANIKTHWSDFSPFEWSH